MSQIAQQSQIISLVDIFFSFKGRLNRRQYWEYGILASIAATIAFFIVAVLFLQFAQSVRATGNAGDHVPTLFIIIGILYYLAGLWATIALQVKRFHDLGRSGWYCLITFVPIFGILWVVIVTYFLAGDTGANRYGPAQETRQRSTAAQIGLVAAGIGFLVAIFAVGRTFIMEPFEVPSTSNEPTIVSGDYVAVSRYAYLLGEPLRGDIAVFVNPHTGEDYIKRIVGLPGDTVQVSHGVLSINGNAVQRMRIADYHERTWLDTYRRYADTTRYRYTETLPGGQSHEILGAELRRPEDGMPQDNTGLFEVPPGHFFAIGDNRDNSNDSRLTLGYVPIANLIGRVEFNYFSRAPDIPTWKVMLIPTAGIRWERLLRVVL